MHDTSDTSQSERTTLVSVSLDRATTIWNTRIAPALMAPLGILVTIPLMVAAVGVTIYWQGRRAVDDSVGAVAERQFRDQAERAAQHAKDLLDHAGPLTDNMVAYVRREGLEPRPEDFAIHFRDLLRACPGVAYVSFGTTDGHYFGVYVDEQGRYIHTNRHYRGPGKTLKIEYLIGDDDQLSLLSREETHDFDPRTRPWWEAAVDKGERIWSKPYVWFDIGVPGVTCSEPIFDEEGNLLAVTTADFHLNGLSEFVADLNPPADDGSEGNLTFIFSDDLKIIAFPGARQEFNQGRAKGKILREKDLTDPVARAFFDSNPMLRRDTRETDLTVDGRPYKAVQSQVEIADKNVRWFVATCGPLDPLTEPADDALRNLLWISVGAVLVAVLLAAFFARFIVRTHLRVERAETRARDADERLARLGSYRLTRKLDEGGMGEVWVAEHDMLARPAAIKLIRPTYMDGKTGAQRTEAVARFRTEARLIAQLRSRHTIGIYDFGVADDGALFYVMELLDGVDLRTLVKQHGPAPQRRAARILAQAAWSLHEAHECGVIHRDIKPANIFLCREAEELDVVKVLDFGVAKQIDGANTAKTVAEGLTGTPSCMSPEQIKGGEEIDGRVDIYALGCVAYWLIAGRNVFVCESSMAMLLAQVKDAPEPLARVAPGPVAPALEAVVMRCLAKKPDDRPADMGVLAAELEAVLATLPVDQWNAKARRAWWARIPSILDETPEDAPDQSLRLRPQRPTRTR